MKFNCGAKSFWVPLILTAGLSIVLAGYLSRSRTRPEPAPEPRVHRTPEGIPTNEPSKPPPPAPMASDPLREWAGAIQRRDEKAVLAAQAGFLGEEEKYREPLVKTAKEHPDPRVRAFSVAVLGRMKTPPPETFFVERLGDAQEYPRTSALQALERLGTTACLGEVDRLAGADPAESVRAAAAKTAKAVRSR